MAFFLSLECSSLEGSIALMESTKKNLTCLAFNKWQCLFNGKHLENSHSDRLPLEVDKLLKTTEKNLSDIDFLAVGAGPGRWTGLRTALNVIRSLSFSLKCPIYPINSLRIAAEGLLPQSQPVFVAINGFKNQVYFIKWQSQNEIEGELQLLSFSDWCLKMKQEQQHLKKEKIFCISDLENFYLLPKELKNSFVFKNIYPNALRLAEIVFRQKFNITPKNWNQIQASYFRSPLG